MSGLFQKDFGFPDRSQGPMPTTWLLGVVPEQRQADFFDRALIAARGSSMLRKNLIGYR